MKIEIKSWFGGAVLFAHESRQNSLRVTLEAAVFARANLAGANLDGANIGGACLARANLDGACLARANLARAYLGGAYLGGANLDGAKLDGAYLAGACLDGANLARACFARANLDGANLAGAKLIGERPVFQIGPIGSRCAYLVSYLTDAGIKICAGCFFGTLTEFVDAVKREHGDSQHGREYMAAVTLIQSHAEIWTPKEEQREAA